MGKEFSRMDRVADQIQQDIANIIQQEVKDPRVGMVSINEVTVSKDLSYAELYFTSLPFGKQIAQDDVAAYRKDCVKVLNNAASFLRTRMAKNLKLRVIPELRFHYDEVLERASHVSSLITQAVAIDEKISQQRHESSPADSSGNENNPNDTAAE